MTTLRTIPTTGCSSEQLAAYAALCADDFLSIRSAEAALAGKRVLHVNSTADGGGVAEMLRSAIALERALGIDSRWIVIDGPAAFFQTTKKIHNSLQGNPSGLTPDEQASYLGLADSLGAPFEAMLADFDPDVIILHDPQPLPLIAIARRHAPVILRLHIDLSTPYAPMLDFLAPLIARASRVILSSDNYRAALDQYPKEHIDIIRPAIDPLAEKNLPLAPDDARAILARHGIDTARPFITQISRFDPWKDPLGAIAAYRIAKASVPELQLVLVGFVEAADDPEAAEWIGKVRAEAGDDADIHIFSDLSQLRDLSSDDRLISALNTLTDTTLQMSRREGFGLTITEAMWKKRPVVARPSRGAEIQISHGENGYLADTPEDVAATVVSLLADPGQAQAIGEAAHTSVAENFLLPKYVAKNIASYLATLE